MASAGPYANYLHLAPDHTSTSSLNFLQAGCSSWCLTNSVKALKTTAVRLKAYWICVWCDSEWHCCCTVFFAPHTTITATTTCLAAVFKWTTVRQIPLFSSFTCSRTLKISSTGFYGPDAIPAIQPTESKYTQHSAIYFIRSLLNCLFPQCKPHSALTPSQTIYHKFSHKDFMATMPIPLESGGRRRMGKASRWFSKVGINALSFLQCSQTAGWVTKGHLAWKKHVPLILKCFLLNQLEKHWVHLD